MPKHDRFVFAALGLVVGVGLALLILVWALPEFRSPTLARQHYENWHATAQIAQNVELDGSHFWVRELHGWVYSEDTIAQWLMAVFSIIATGTSIWAVLLLRGTLAATREANANAADGVAAARDAVSEATRIGEAQVRSYLQIVEGHLALVPAALGITDQQVRPVVTIRVKNYGQSPARWFQWSAIARYHPPLHGEFRGSLHFPPKTWGQDIGVGETETFELNLGSATLTDADMHLLAHNVFHIDLVVRYIFEDVFGISIEDERVFTTYVPPNGIGMKASLIRHPFSRETIEEHARQNSPENLAAMREDFARTEAAPETMGLSE